jgi:hypothetical protein
MCLCEACVSSAGCAAAEIAIRRPAKPPTAAALTTTQNKKHLSAIGQIVCDSAVHGQLRAVLESESERRAELHPHGAVVAAQRCVGQPQQSLLSITQLHIQLLVTHTHSHTHGDVRRLCRGIRNQEVSQDGSCSLTQRARNECNQQNELLSASSSCASTSAAYPCTHAYRSRLSSPCCAPVSYDGRSPTARWVGV